MWESPKTHHMEEVQVILNTPLINSIEKNIKPGYLQIEPFNMQEKVGVCSGIEKEKEIIRFDQEM